MGGNDLVTICLDHAKAFKVRTMRTYARLTTLLALTMGSSFPSIPIHQADSSEQRFDHKERYVWWNSPPELSAPDDDFWPLTSTLSGSSLPGSLESSAKRLP